MESGGITFRARKRAAPTNDKQKRPVEIDVDIKGDSSPVKEDEIPGDVLWCLEEDAFEKNETDMALRGGGAYYDSWYNAEERDQVDGRELDNTKPEEERWQPRQRAVPNGKDIIERKTKQREANQRRWEDNQLQRAGVGARREINFANIAEADEAQQGGVPYLELVERRPPFLLNADPNLEETLGAKAAMAKVYRDETSDLVVLAKRGSGLVHMAREAEDRGAMRQKFWELQGSAMGELLNVEGPAQYVGVQQEEDEGPSMALGAALTSQTGGDALLQKAQSIAAQRASLPVAAVREQLLDTISEHQVVVVVGETGSGKTTQLVQYLLESGLARDGMIGCSQPRRVAAVSVAQRVAEERGVKLGEEVGYAIRFEDATSRSTKIKFMTDGVLLREVLTDADVEQYSAIIMDEAHERSLNTDVLMGVIKQVLRRRTDFRLIVTSATLDHNRFSVFFGGAPVFHIPGRTFPVRMNYLTSPCGDYVQAAVEQALQIHCDIDRQGDILIFMTGREDIELCCVELQNRMTSLLEETGAPPLLVLPIYSNLPPEMQVRIFKKVPQRKCIVATNIAETSLTLDGVRFVIDAAYHKVKVYNPSLNLDVLVMVPISQAAAKQRAGRAGRTGPGVCYRLYTERAFLAELLDVNVPELQRTNLASTVLLLRSLGIQDVLSFDFLDPPSRSAVLNALHELWVIGALADEGELTPIGLTMVSYPIEPTLARTLIMAREMGCLTEVLMIAALLSVPPIFFRPRDREAQADAAREKFFVPESDHLTLLNAFKLWRKHGRSAHWAAEHFLHQRVLKKGMEVHSQLRDIVTKNRRGDARGLDSSCRGDYDLVRKTLCGGYFHHSARMKGIGEYSNMRTNVTAYIHPTSALYGGGEPHDYVVYHEIMVTTREYMQHATAVMPEWLAEMGPKFFRLHSDGTRQRPVLPALEGSMIQLKDLKRRKLKWTSGS